MDERESGKPEPNVTIEMLKKKKRVEEYSPKPKDTPDNLEVMQQTETQQPKPSVIEQKEVEEQTIKDRTRAWAKGVSDSVDKKVEKIQDKIKGKVKQVENTVPGITNWKGNVGAQTLKEARAKVEQTAKELGGQFIANKNVQGFVQGSNRRPSMPAGVWGSWGSSSKQVIPKIPKGKKGKNVKKKAIAVPQVVQQPVIQQQNYQPQSAFNSWNNQQNLPQRPRLQRLTYQQDAYERKRLLESGIPEKQINDMIRASGYEPFQSDSFRINSTIPAKTRINPTTREREIIPLTGYRPVGKGSFYRAPFQDRMDKGESAIKEKFSYFKPMWAGSGNSMNPQNWYNPAKVQVKKFDWRNPRGEMFPTNNQRPPYKPPIVIIQRFDWRKSDIFGNKLSFKPFFTNLKPKPKWQSEEEVQNETTT